MYNIRKRIVDYFSPYTSPSFGAIKPALVRLEKNNNISSTKIMSEGGKLSIFYSIKKEGEKHLKELLVSPISQNAVQFMSDARIKLSCASVLDNMEATELYQEIKTCALLHKINAEKILSNDYLKINSQHKIILDNVICEYKNLISLVEGLEKAN